MKTSPDYSVPALEKGLDILEVLSQSAEPLTLSRLAGLLGRKNNEIFRMLNLLERRNYVLRNESGSYRLSLRMYQLAHAQSMVAQLIEAAMPAMRELSSSTGESCHLSVLEGMEIVILARVESSHPVRLVVELGGRFSALTTVSGRMMLAAKEPSVRRELFDSAPEVRQLKPAARRTLTQKIEKAASEGLSTAQDETVTGVIDAAVAIGDSSGGILAAVAIAALTSEGRNRSPEDFRAPLEKCAREIRSRLGIPRAT